MPFFPFDNIKGGHFTPCCICCVFVFTTLLLDALDQWLYFVVYGELLSKLREFVSVFSFFTPQFINYIICFQTISDALATWKKHFSVYYLYLLIWRKFTFSVWTILKFHLHFLIRSRLNRHDRMMSSEAKPLWRQIMLVYVLYVDFFGPF